MVAVAAWCACVGCDKSEIPARAGAAEPRAHTASPDVPRDQSPANVVRRLQSLYQQRDYARIAPLIVEDRRDATLQLLEAVDEVIDANAALQMTAKNKYAAVPSETWNLAAMEDNLGPFSKHICIINQRFKGATAVVTLQGGDNIPLVHAAFELVGVEWQYRPERTPFCMLTELRKLARILRDVEESVVRGAPLDSYFDAFLYRVLPQISRVATATDESSLAVAVGNETE